MSLRRNSNYESVTLSIYPAQMKKLLEMQAADPACPSLSYLLRGMVIDKLGGNEKPAVRLGSAKKVQPKQKPAVAKATETKTDTEAK